MKVPRSLLWAAGGLGCLVLLAIPGLLWLFAVAASIPGASDYTTRLPNGYFLMRQWRGSSLIFQDRDEDHIYDPAMEVGPSEYGILMAVMGRYIVGNLDTEEEARGVPEVPDRYFIIDTQTDTIVEELSFQEYERRMHELGFKELPELIRPNKLTRFVK